MNKDHKKRGQSVQTCNPPNEISFFCRIIREPNTLFTLFVAFFTLLIAIIGAVQAYSYIQSERPFVVHQNFDVNGYQDVRNNMNLTYRIAPIWANVGNTPTREMTIYVGSLRVVSESGAYDFTTPEDTKFTPVYLGPKSTLEGAARFISGKELLDIRGGKKTYYIWGWVTYRDVFDRFFPWSAPHITRFCDIIDSVYGDPTAPNNGPIGMGTSFCPTYNCADEDCERQDRNAKSANDTAVK